MIELPANVESETALLGGLLLAGSRFDEASAHVVPDDFTVDAHRTIWQTMMKLARDYTLIAVDTVTSRLAAERELDHVGGPLALSDLAAEGCVAGSIAYHAREVAAVSRRRKVVDQARRLALHAANERDGIDQAIDTAVEQMTSRTAQAGIVSRDDLELAVIDRLTQGTDTGVSTGWDNLDRFYRVPRGMVTVVTGVPGHGKSTWLDCLVVNLAKQHGWRMAMFSPEQSPPSKHALNLIQTASGADPQHLGDGLQSRMDWVLDHFTMLDDQADNTVPGILSRARLVAQRGQLDGLVIDPWNKIAHDRARHGSDQLYLQDALHRLTRFARHTGVHVWVVAHPVKMQREPGTASRWEVPSVYDILGGSEWNNQADAIVCVWRDQDSEKDDGSITTVAVQKVRDSGVWGRIGGVRLKFAEDRRRFARLSMLESTERTKV